MTLVLLAAPSVRGVNGDVMVRTSRSVYYAGEPVAVIFQAGYGGGVPGTAQIIVSGPAGTVTAGTVNIVTGVTYTYTISGSFLTIPGYYTVKVVVGLEFDIWEGTASFQIVARAPFDFTISLSPSTITVKKGETARFNWAVTYSDPSYQGISFTWDVSGLDRSMRVNVARGILDIATSDATPPGAYSFTFSLSARGLTRSAAATLMVEALFDYSLSISPTSQTVNIGEENSYTVTVSLVSGAAQPVSLTVTGLPSDVSSIFTPPSGTPTYTTTLTVDASSSSSPGSYTLTVTATGGGIAKTATATLIVKEKDFELTVQPETITLEQGDSASLQVQVKPLGQFDKPVSLTVSGAPSGVTSGFTVSSGLPPYTSTLNLNVPLSTREGSYILDIRGEGGGKNHSVEVALIVKKKPFTLTIRSEVEGVNVKVTGALTPPTPGTKLTLRYSSSEFSDGEGGAVTRIVNVKPDGSFSDEFTPSALGEWDVRATLYDESGNALAVSESEHFTVEKSFMNKLTLLARQNPLLMILPALAIIVAAVGAIAVRRRRRIKPGFVQAPMYCQHCGAPLKAEDEFCTSCGARKS
ncbi:MAG: zinc ribbon domain-containing protein [Candidatus Bathyarchaeia archaeon]